MVDSSQSMTRTTSDDYEEEKEDTSNTMTKSLGELKITKTLIENSLDASNPYVTSLMDELDQYTSWSMIDSMCAESIKAYSRGKKDFRMTMTIKCNDVMKVAKYFVDLDKRAKWDNTKWSLAKKEAEGHSCLLYTSPSPRDS